MKNLFKVSILFVFFLFTINQITFSQSGESFNLKPFGIGLHVEQFKVGEIATISEGISASNKFIFSFNTNDNFRIEPEIGFIFGKNKTSDAKFEGLSLGIGLSKLNFINKLLLYYGGRFNYNYSKGGIVKVDILNLGPILGGEFFLGEHFSFGGEIAIKYNFLKFKFASFDYPMENETSETYYFSTESGLLMRFYF